jgi:hypothetical protein
MTVDEIIEKVAELPTGEPLYYPRQDMAGGFKNANLDTDDLKLLANHAKDLEGWLERVISAWELKWRDHEHDHRYKRDLPAFIGERFLNDFNLRHLETEARRKQSQAISRIKEGRG